MIKKMSCVAVLIFSLSACSDVRNIKEFDKSVELNLSDNNEYEEEKDGVLYKNDEMNIQLEIPFDWSGKYIVHEDPGVELSFVHKSTYDKHGMGELFYLRKVQNEDLLERSNWAQEEVLWQNEEYAYVLGLPTDVQVPDGLDSDEEDKLLVAEYNKMSSEIPSIKQTFSLINKKEEL